MKNKRRVNNIIQTIKFNSELSGHTISKPESIKIIRNSIDDTYNLYALMSANYILNGEEVNQLISLKSEKLRQKIDMDMSFEFSAESNCCYAKDRNGVSLFPLFSYDREFLYRLILSKNADVLCELSVLNKGDDFMNYNIFDGLENYTVQIDTAGFSKEELFVTTDENLIIVKAIPRNNLDIEDSECTIRGIKKTKSQCEIYLPNFNNIEAEYKDGILTLTVSKKIKSTKVEIK